MGVSARVPAVPAVGDVAAVDAVPGSKVRVKYTDGRKDHKDHENEIVEVINKNSTGSPQKDLAEGLCTVSLSDGRVFKIKWQNIERAEPLGPGVREFKPATGQGRQYNPH